MNIPMSWLKDYVNINCDIKTFIEEMTMSGSKVETVEYVAEEITKVVIGKIEEIEQHPDADKLVVCQVNIGEETIQIVTGAKNVFVGAIVPVALSGSTLSGGLKIKKGKLRGVVSNGMFCSVEELGYTREDFPESPEDGIYIFDKDLKLGSCVKEALGLNDTVVEFEITSNRADCLSIMGIAREASATFNVPFNVKEINIKEECEQNTKDLININIENKELCNRYSARVIKDVKIEPSPQWIRTRLLSAGVRPINNIVDITNYVMLEYGQPLHAFDLNDIEDNTIVVRNAKVDEKVVSLDGEERVLSEDMLVIADTKKALAVAGVIGLENSKTKGKTNTILLESANFNGTNVRLTSKKLGLRTESSSKFEKGLDSELVVKALNRATELIVTLGYGKACVGVVDEYPNKKEVKKVEFNAKTINKLLGTEISESEMVSILEKLEIKVEEGYAISPSFRSDLERSADLAEEVARIYGYNNIPTKLIKSSATVGKLTYSQNLTNTIRNTMTAQGFYEIMNYSFESEKVFDKLNVIQDSHLRKVIKINNPLGEDFSAMRTTTLNGMLNSLSENFNKRVDVCSLFEIGKVYLAKELPLKELPIERNILTIGMYGKCDFYDIKGVIENILDSLNIEDVDFMPDKNITYLHPGRSAVAHINGERLLEVGEVYKKVSDNYGLKTRVYVAEINIDLLIKYANSNIKFKELPKYPASNRDIAILVKNDVLVRDIELAIKEKGGKILESINLFDIYEGDQIDKNYKSIAYSLTFRAKDKTLTDEQISGSMNKILKNLEEKLDITLRK